MSEYDDLLLQKSSLKFKGDKRGKRNKDSGKDRKRRFEEDSDQPGSNKDLDERLEDAEVHGGWWAAEKYNHIKGDVAIEFLPSCYAKAVSNGTVILGDPHPPGEGPEEEEIFTIVNAGTNSFALKSGFGRYLSVNSDRKITGLSEAIGEQESFLVSFEDGKTAISAANECFLSVEDGSDTRHIIARATWAGQRQMVTIRINFDPYKLALDQSNFKREKPESGILYEAEVGHIKKLQSGGFEGQSLERDKKQLKRARNEGRLHEALLDHRVKHKSDKYCK